MKVRITERKAPWPQGAKVGDVVEIAAETLPGWALGKATPVADDVEAQHQYLSGGGDQHVQVDGSVTLTREQLQELSDRVSELQQLNTAQALTIEQLIEDVKTGNRDESALREQLASSQSLAASEKGRADDLQAQLDAAKKPAEESAVTTGTAAAKASKK